jgi:mRNA interferase RelE/StbE
MKRQSKRVGRMLKVKYEVKIDKQCLKDLEKIPEHFRDAINKKVKALADDPRPDGYIKLKGSKNDPLYHIRYGDYRIVYAIKDDILVVLVIEIGHRREIYR